MVDQSVFDPNKIRETAASETSGLLDELNLPPGFIAFLRKNQRPLWIIVAVVATVVTVVSLYGSYQNYRENKAVAALDAAMLADKGQQVSLFKQVITDYASTPTGHWARIELAKIDIKAGRLDDAIAQFTQVNQEIKEGNPLKPLVLYKLAGLLEEKKDYDTALARYQELVMFHGFDADAQYAMARVYTAMDKKPEAVTAYQQYLSLTEKSPAGGQGRKRAMVEYIMKKLE